jgi:pSer/pThr/pTyr-binding forkhead associated (FHA) protein
MDPALLLFILRLASALLLFGFLVLIAWLIYRDVQATAAATAAQEQRQVQLKVIANESGTAPVGTVYPLQPITSIGRAAGNTIVLDDHYASNEHALLTRRGELWWVEDLGSRNGLLLNDLPLREATVVSAGDVITIGGTKMKLEF